ncbi:DNA-binding protein [Saccharibacillus sacchari]|uniref:DNA-binding protein n=1 Tax=Saccharibacillus sacchari TaxID=456493 RepID=A0ACC6PC30_9BACL
MEMTMTLRSEIEKGIAEMGMNFSEFGEFSGINRGIFSAILNSNPPKPISLNQLERITKAFGQEEGWMFELYIEECFYDGRPNRRRVEPFLIRCAELERNDCIEKVLSRLLEDLKHLDMIFEIGETLYTSSKVKESVVFYQCIVQNEKYHQSERLAVSHYRLFRAALGEDNERNLRAAIEFEPFCDKLPDHHRLDGLMKLVNVYFSLDKYDEAEIYSRELSRLSKIVFENRNTTLNDKIGLDIYEQTEYALIVYYGYSYLAMQSIMINNKNYEQVAYYISKCNDLNRIPGLDEEAKNEVSKFNFHSRANEMYLKVANGDQKAFHQCVKFIRKHPEELLVALLFITEHAIEYNYPLDPLLHEFSQKLDRFSYENSYYHSTNNFSRQMSICYNLAIWYAEQKKHKKSLDYLLKGLTTAISIKSTTMFMKYVPLFENYRSKASYEQIVQYEKLIGGLLI